MNTNFIVEKNKTQMKNFKKFDLKYLLKKEMIYEYKL